MADWFNGDITLAAITDGGYTSKDVPQAYKDEDSLLAACKEAVRARASAPFAGRATCAILMEDVIKTLQRTGTQYPHAWLKVKKQLEKTPGPCMGKVEVEPVIPIEKPGHWVGHQTHDGPPNANDVIKNKYALAGWELCTDWMMRDPAGRASAGYTHKGADGIWYKPPQAPKPASNDFEDMLEHYWPTQPKGKGKE